MSLRNLSVHQTTTHRIKDTAGEHWEFVCPTCNYRARYKVNPHRGPHLEVLNGGDPQARHTSNHVHITPPGIWPEPAPDGNESWLTPELRQQMEDLLRDVDMGDKEM